MSKSKKWVDRIRHTQASATPLSDKDRNALLSGNIRPRMEALLNTKQEDAAIGAFVAAHREQLTDVFLASFHPPLAGGVSEATLGTFGQLQLYIATGKDQIDGRLQQAFPETELPTETRGALVKLYHQFADEVQKSLAPAKSKGGRSHN